MRKHPAQWKPRHPRAQETPTVPGTVSWAEVLLALHVLVELAQQDLGGPLWDLPEFSMVSLHGRVSPVKRQTLAKLAQVLNDLEREEQQASTILEGVHVA